MEASGLFTPHQMLVMKISVAVAIIRCKPAKTSSRQFAEELAHQHRESEETWKTRASRLEEEVLHLRQQQLMPSLPGQQQPEQQPEQAMDSCGADAGLETYSNEQSNQGGTPTAQAQARGQGLSASQRDTPLPVHMHMHGSARLSDDAQQALQQHCAFLLALQEAGSLAAWKESNGGASGLGDNLALTFRETVFRVTRALWRNMDSYPSNAVIPHELLRKAVNALIASFDLCTEQDLQEAIAGELWKLLQCMIKHMLNNTSSFIVRGSQQVQLSWCVSQLGIHLPALTLDTCTTLVDHLCVQLNTLKEQSNDVLNVDYEQLDRAFYCCKALEDLLASTAHMLPEAEAVSMSRRLDEAVVAGELCEHFPQVSHYVWRLEALLTQQLLAADQHMDTGDSVKQPAHGR
ncbi:meiosis-specific protein MEI4-like [Sycon ciliatum]|uniref:meiosis-specific protein MEI4-like n=1 Tax=Sycon ciliatum TaxID=27933 RepID=UPI0031F677D4